MDNHSDSDVHRALAALGSDPTNYRTFPRAASPEAGASGAVSFPLLSSALPDVDWDNALTRVASLERNGMSAAFDPAAGPEPSRAPAAEPAPSRTPPINPGPHSVPPHILPEERGRPPTASAWLRVPVGRPAAIVPSTDSGAAAGQRSLAKMFSVLRHRADPGLETPLSTIVRKL